MDRWTGAWMHGSIACSLPPRERQPFVTLLAGEADSPASPLPPALLRAQKAPCGPARLPLPPCPVLLPLPALLCLCATRRTGSGLTRAQPDPSLNTFPGLPHFFFSHSHLDPNGVPSERPSRPLLTLQWLQCPPDASLLSGFSVGIRHAKLPCWFI